MRDDPMILGYVAMFATVAIGVLLVLAYLLQPATMHAPQFPAQNVDCAVPLVEAPDGSLSCPRYRP